MMVFGLSDRAPPGALKLVYKSMRRSCSNSSTVEVELAAGVKSEAQHGGETEGVGLRGAAPAGKLQAQTGMGCLLL